MEENDDCYSRRHRARAYTMRRFIETVTSPWAQVTTASQAEQRHNTTTAAGSKDQIVSRRKKLSNEKKLAMRRGYRGSAKRHFNTSSSQSTRGGA